mmetsp:Transcript_2883/g.8116  ORF Transcript_2883/g.8116 Transcript_2883/m.8116 type:complete len:253 (+) Transcript_2883:1282-2040(+)
MPDSFLRPQTTQQQQVAALGQSTPQPSLARSPHSNSDQEARQTAGRASCSQQTAAGRWHIIPFSSPPARVTTPTSGACLKKSWSDNYHSPRFVHQESPWRSAGSASLFTQVHSPVSHAARQDSDGEEDILEEDEMASEPFRGPSYPLGPVSVRSFGGQREMTLPRIATGIGSSPSSLPPLRVSYRGRGTGRVSRPGQHVAIAQQLPHLSVAVDDQQLPHRPQTVTGMKVAWIARRRAAEVQHTNSMELLADS